MAHNYQPGEVQDIADFSGDSLELSRKAAETDAEVILFCGVHFMAETAAILSPEKTVLAARPDAGCPMADMIDAKGVRDARKEHPGAVVICYVNTTAAVKAECDVTCTSANAKAVVESFDKNQQIVFVPDYHLGSYVQHLTGRELVLWPGHCPIHAGIHLSDVERARRQFPQAELWAHPECRLEVSLAVDFSLSTGQMVKRARKTDADTVVVATELGMLYRLRQERPDITFVPITEQAICVDMKLTRLADVRNSLSEMKNIVTVPEEIRVRAVQAVERMLEI